MPIKINFKIAKFDYDLLPLLNIFPNTEEPCETMEFWIKEYKCKSSFLFLFFLKIKLYRWVKKNIKKTNL